jgi:adenylate kinase
MLSRARSVEGSVGSSAEKGPALRIVLLGPPGSGKGTQAVRLCERYKLAHVSTGDILRQNIQQDTELGRAAQECMRMGKLVPDSLIHEMLKDLYLRRQADNVSFILDGFPRSVEQAQVLSDFLEDRGQTVHKVILLEIPDEDLVGRLTNRRTCPKCGRTYHLVSRPPCQYGVCDADGEPLCWRPDDHEEVIRNRLETYHSQTSPVADFYQQKGTLTRIEANVSIEQVEARITAVMDELVGISG